ncbi:MAG: TonB-dependent receptor plug domain-containing protein, partial [Cyclobacteriaceae bacterium]
MNRKTLGWNHSVFKAILFVPLLFVFLTSAAQSVTVSGKVLDGDGVGLPGVTILEKGTSNGTTTDLDGNYTINVSGSDAILVFSSVGFVQNEVVVGTQTSIDLSMTEDVLALGEVVVIGYGTVNKSDLTGSLDHIDSKNFNQGPITSPLQQITGRAAGVNINQVGSEPGQAPTIRIRGITSLAGGNDPLVVVDGIQGDMSLLTQIPPSEIESIDVLKDASATAIYGSRGAPGVVIVTTKRGAKGAAQVEYSGTIALETISSNYDVLSADEWRDVAAERGVLEAADRGGDTDWLKKITRKGYTQ